MDENNKRKAFKPPQAPARDGKGFLEWAEQFAAPAGQEPRKRIEIEATDEIVLRCGRASITLSRTGEIEIRGVNLLSRASASNKIKGAIVHLN